MPHFTRRPIDHSDDTVLKFKDGRTTTFLRDLGENPMRSTIEPIVFNPNEEREDNRRLDEGEL